MAGENVTWGAERIRGELLKIGIKLGKRIIQRYLPRTGRPPASPSAQTRATILKNHAPQNGACDFTQVYNLFLQSLFVFAIIELSSR